MALTFFFEEQIIEVPDTTNTISLQTLINEIRDEEDELCPAMAYSKIADAYGKQDLGGGVKVGITLVLLENWKLRFQARDPEGPVIACFVTGGNLVAVSGNPIAPSTNTQVTIAQSSSPTIATPESDTNLLYLVETLIGNHRGVGSYFYWDPFSGDDAKAGATPSTAVKHFAQAQILAASGSNNVIFCMSSHPSGITTVNDEILNITVNNLKVRGPGYSFQLIPASPGNDTVTIAADRVELSGFYISTAAGGPDNGIKIYNTPGTVDSVIIKDCWVAYATGNGIDISSSSRTKIEKCAIENCSGNGIQMGAATALSLVSTCILTGNADGVDLTGSGLTNNIFENNLIYNNTGYGIDIGPGVTRTGVRFHHTFSGNLASTRDQEPTGKQTFIETAGAVTPDDRALIAVEVADAVWTEVISGVTTPGSAGKMLKDAKTKATLASLK